ncbi:NitT/TauT family transport system substrate-binding protein [Gammaproteobacteria bacterium]
MIFGLILPSSPCQGGERITISVPGPRSLPYLPVDLIPKIGADQAEGVHLRILYTGGSAAALNNLNTRDTDFAVAGVPAQMSLRSNGGDVVLIAAVNDAPLFVLMVRSALKEQVKRIADLKGKVIGVHPSTSSSKTSSQQLAELLLRSDGVVPDAVHLVSAGQNWVEISALVISSAVDAIMGSEPFASRLLAEGHVFYLANLAESSTVTGIQGTHFLHAALATRNDMIAQTPKKVATMVRILKKTLAWISSHTPEQIVDALEITDPQEHDALVFSLKKYPNAFSRDGSFSNRQLQETDYFFHAGGEDNLQSLLVNSMIDDHWVGRNP